MIELFFTGAKSFLAPQEKGVNSLGGFISNTNVPNNYLNGIYTKISQFAQNKDGFFDMVCLAVKNVGSEPIENLSVWIQNTSLQKACDFEVSFVKPAINDKSEQYFEKVNTRKQQPFYGTPFQKANLETEKAVFEQPILPNAYIGIWFKRNIFVKKNSPCVVESEIELIEKTKFIFEW